MPRNRGDGALDGLFEMLGDPPIVLLLEVADRYYTGAGSHGELGFGGRPAHKGRRTIDSEQNQCRFPPAWRRFPYIGVAISRIRLARHRGRIRIATLRASHNLPASGGDIDRSDGLIVSLQHVLNRKVISGPLVKLDIAVSCHGQGLSVCGEGVIGDRMMEEQMNFRSCHCDEEVEGDRRSSQLSLDLVKTAPLCGYDNDGENFWGGH